MASSVKTPSWTKEIRERNKIGDEEKFMQQYGYLCKHKMAHLKLGLYRDLDPGRCYFNGRPVRHAF